MKVAVIFALVAVALADKPAPSYRPSPAPYKPPPAPAPYHPPPPPPPSYKQPGPYKGGPYKGGPYKEEKPSPKPYTYQYGVQDEYSGASYQKSENQDDYGNLQGSYKVALPDGRIQIVTYRADHENGFVADVQYEGTAVYPPEPKEGYGYHPAKHAPPKYAQPPKYPPPPPKYAPAKA